MRLEIPVFTRCCFYFPLRHGLIFWACFRVLLSIGTLVVMSLRWSTLSNDPHTIETLTNHTEWLCFVIIIALVDIILGLLYIVSSNMKNAKLMKSYYYHNIFLLVLLISLCVYNIAWFIKMINFFDFPFVEAALFMIQAFVITFSYISAQLYIILLVRSEITKLETGSDFRFENPAAVAEQTLNIEVTNTEDDKKYTEVAEEIVQIDGN